MVVKEHPIKEISHRLYGQTTKKLIDRDDPRKTQTWMKTKKDDRVSIFLEDIGLLTNSSTRI